MTVVNLKNARKQRTRAEKEKQSAENRSRFGRTKATKLLIDAERLHAEKQWDGHRLAGEDEKTPS